MDTETVLMDEETGTTDSNEALLAEEVVVTPDNDEVTVADTVIDSTGNSESLGTVKWFSRLKGWGFIEPDGGDRDVFVHYESIVGEGFRNLEKGERVRFRIEDTPRGPKAVNVITDL